MRELVLETVRAARSKLTKRGRGFEWLGFDVMVVEAPGFSPTATAAAADRPEGGERSGAIIGGTTGGKAAADDGSERGDDASSRAGFGPLAAYLIEANTSPDVSHSTDVTSALVPVATRDLLRVVLDERLADRLPASNGKANERAKGVGVRQRRPPAAPAHALASSGRAAEGTSLGATGDGPSAVDREAVAPGAEQTAVKVISALPSTAGAAGSSARAVALPRPLDPRRVSPCYAYRGPVAASAEARETAADEGGGHHIAPGPQAAAAPPAKWASVGGFPEEPRWMLWCAGEEEDESARAGAEPQLGSAKSCGGLTLDGLAKIIPELKTPPAPPPTASLQPPTAVLLEPSPPAPCPAPSVPSDEAEPPSFFPGTLPRPSPAITPPTPVRGALTPKAAGKLKGGEGGREKGGQNGNSGSGSDEENL
mmetsp:Transcript_60526/g.136794  ORF Transcript_60526/g.136794 Transcript_60526/m.136794 type:complete len:425 (-) Transcript_60526:106-1380(-)